MHALTDFSILVLPGRNGSDADHWQTLWQHNLPNVERVEQTEWVRPVYADWAANLSAAVARSTKPTILVAHSLGTSLAVRWVFDNPEAARRVAGAFLVAPSDRDLLNGNPAIPVTGFGGMVLRALPFPSMVVASRNDELVSYDRATAFARAWGAHLVDAGANGHLGSSAGLGLWPLGLVALGQLVASIATDRQAP